LRFKTLVMIVAMVACANMGDLMLKRGMNQIGAVQLTSVDAALQGFELAMFNATIWIGILFLFGFIASYLTVLSWADYSYVMPVGAVGYVVVTLLGMTVLHETVTLKRWIGVGLIFFGVLLVGQTNPRTTEGLG